MIKDRKILLGQMLRYIVSLEKYIKNIDYEGFVLDEQKYDACVLKLALIGEIGVKMEGFFGENTLTFSFHQMRGIRNRIIHDYLGLDSKIIWDTIKDDIPILKK